MEQSLRPVDGQTKQNHVFIFLAPRASHCMGLRGEGRGSRVIWDVRWSSSEAHSQYIKHILEIFC